jgi:hypothetical protein
LGSLPTLENWKKKAEKKKKKLLVDFEVGKEGSMQRTKGVLGADFIQGKLGTSNEPIHRSYVLKYIQILSKK